MPFAFLVPLFLAGMAAIAVPVMVHLRRRERERPMKFPSLMFLQRVPFITARRRRITDWPLLLLRVLIVVLAALAFARPVLRPKPGVAARGAKRIVVLLDRSLSMSHQAVWPAALDSARAIVNALAPEDKVAVVAFDEDASVTQTLTTDHALALAALGRITPNARGTRYGAGLRAGREVLIKDATQSGGELVVVSDLQRTGSAGLAGLTLPPSVTVRGVNASPAPHGNTAIARLDVQRLAGTGDERGRLAVAARVNTRGLSAERRARLALLVNGRPTGERQATLAAEGTTTVAFDAVPLPVGEVRIEVSVEADSLSADDVFRAVLPADVTRRVVMAVPADATDDETLYFEHALATGHDPALRIERRNVNALDAVTLRDATVVFLYDVPPPGGTAATALDTWVRAGGGVIIAAGTRLGARPPQSALLPGAVRGMVDRRESGGTGGVFGDLALDHPIFTPFRGAASASLGASHFFRYARVTAAGGASVLARFDDGNVALVEQKTGEGHVLLTAVPLDVTSGDFPLQPTYLPFLRGVALYAAGQAVVPYWRTTGEGWIVPALLQTPIIKVPSEDLLRPDRAQGGGTVALEQAGFYTVYDGRASGDPVTMLAVNTPVRESDLTPMNANELLVGVGQDSTTTSEMSVASLTEAEGRQRIWKWLLLAAATLLVVETVMASRGWRASASHGGIVSERSGS